MKFKHDTRKDSDNLRGQELNLKLIKRHYLEKLSCALIWTSANYSM